MGCCREFRREAGRRGSGYGVLWLRQAISDTVCSATCVPRQAAAIARDLCHPAGRTLPPPLQRCWTCPTAHAPTTRTLRHLAARRAAGRRRGSPRQARSAAPPAPRRRPQAAASASRQRRGANLPCQAGRPSEPRLVLAARAAALASAGCAMMRAWRAGADRRQGTARGRSGTTKGSLQAAAPCAAGRQTRQASLACCCGCSRVGPSHRAVASSRRACWQAPCSQRPVRARQAAAAVQPSSRNRAARRLARLVLAACRKPLKRHSRRSGSAAGRRGSAPTSLACQTRRGRPAQAH